MEKINKKEIQQEYNTYADAIRNVPTDILAQIENYKNGLVDSEFEELNDLCQEFVSNAREKLTTIADKAKLKKRGWE
jgi:hypothetical protein